MQVFFPVIASAGCISCKATYIFRGVSKPLHTGPYSYPQVFSGSRSTNWDQSCLFLCDLKMIINSPYEDSYLHHQHISIVIDCKKVPLLGFSLRPFSSLLILGSWCGESLSAIELNAHVPTGQDEMVYTCEIGSLSKRDHAVAGGLFNPSTDSGNEGYGYQIRDQPYVHHCGLVDHQTAAELHSLVDKFQTNVKILKQLGEETDHWDVLLIHLLSTRLDSSTRRDWEDFAETNECTKFHQLIEFLQRRVNVLETVKNKSYESAAISKKPNPPRTGSHGAVQQGFRSCPVCSSQHFLYQCESFAKMTVNEKEGFVRRNKLCRNCLRRGHMAKDCSSESYCRKCRGRHHTQLCYVSKSDSTSNAASSQPASVNQLVSSSAPSQPSMPSGSQTSTPTVHTGITSCISSDGSRTKVLLATAIVMMVDDEGSEHPVRALLDSGSECCFATERVAQRMRVRRSRVNLPIAGIGQASTEVRCKFLATVKSRVSSYSTTIEAFVLPKVTIDLPSISVDASSWTLPTGIQLADPSFYQSGAVDLVLGAEVFFDLFNVAGRIPLGDTLPPLINSVFGWVISGKTPQRQSRSPITCNVATTADIQRSMEKFWKIEDDAAIAYSPEEAYCEKFFRETTVRGDGGRYIVRIPFKDGALDNLGTNRRTAFHRFRLIEARLGRDPNLAAEYRKFMDEYEKLGHMKRVNESETTLGPAYFLPHHPVIREESSTTKVRVVFDASCRSTTGVSLNEVMLVGPVVQEDLRSIIMRSRLHSVMLIADVDKMYRQITLSPDDNRLHLIFWRASPSNNIQIYKLLTMTYGTASVPYLATRVLKKLADDEEKTIHWHLRSVAEAVKLRKQMEEMFNSAGMQLRKWASNIPSALQGVPNDNRALQSSVEFDKDQSIKTLGLHWEPHSDQLKYLVPKAIVDPSAVVTKRSALSCIARLFDPLGLVGPVVVRAKMFMQELWGLKDDNDNQYDWDKELPEDMKDQWVRYYTELPQLNTLRIDRFVVLPEATSLELHFFSDASIAAYGACAYIRSSNSSGEVKVALLTSRSKVAPLKQQSIPRLELCGALLSAELYVKVAAALRITSNAYFWVDSTTVLSWLKATPSTWSTFVGNRVSKIQHKSQNCEWNHVAGRENPADVISRGLPAADLMECERWWRGPSWLRCDKDAWPIPVDGGIDQEAFKEARKSSHITASPSPTFAEDYVNQFSNFQHMLRITAYWRRYFANLRLPRTERVVSSPLTTVELQGAELALIRLVQMDSFPTELKAVEAQQLVSSRSRLRWFNPLIDSDGVLRIGGRIGRSAQSYDSCHQILLPGSHPFSSLLVRCQHERLLHAATQLLMNTIRLRYWILGGRNVIRRVVHRCVTCFRAKPKVVEQFMAELPVQRVTASRPFSIVGIDFWGPIYLKPRHRRDSPPKAYVAVFICFSTKAVHLELVVDLSTAKFLQAFRRFVARRGLCAEVFSDNGKNFVGAANELRRLLRAESFRQSFASECSNNGIHWHFNPPRASHFGGLWEAAINSAQKHFVRVLGDRKLPFDDMETLLVQIEACLNSRPLTKLSDDPSDLQALTPGHFLVGSSLQSVPDGDYTSIPTNRLHSWQQIQKLLQDVWKRWHVEYLQSLQPRSKWLKQSVQLKENQLVIIVDENQPPMRWPIARVKELHPGKDGVVRVVTLQTTSGLLTRPTAKICILPISATVDDQSAASAASQSS
ncbi:uncharacterized protein LOC134221673 [Armigeres subalbatus]|uniref:uncharacterized protein LOC134221673 n=1 Tax=Armigeres subalbatus TaxID=124917 RepID=UPI002ED68066